MISENLFSLGGISQRGKQDKGTKVSETDRDYNSRDCGSAGGKGARSEG